MSQFKFSAGPYTVEEGGDLFGPEVRQPVDLETKLKKFKEIGISANSFHDDDVVPDINNLEEAQIKQTAQQFKQLLDKYGIATETISPRLWTDARTIDGAFTSNRESDREFAMWRAYRSIDIANTLGCDFVNLWLSRDGILCYESKNIVASVNRIKEAINKMLEYDKNIKILLEPKPTISVDESFLPTVGHAIGLSLDTIDPARVGVLMQVAGSIIGGSDPVFEIAFANSFHKLWAIHLNDQSGLGYAQDKTFGVENIRRAFNIIKALVENNYDEFIGMDIKAMRTQKTEDCYRHLYNTIRIIEMLEKKVAEFDYDFQSKCIQERNYQKLEMYVMELLLKE